MQGDKRQQLLTQVNYAVRSHKLEAVRQIHSLTIPILNMNIGPADALCPLGQLSVVRSCSSATVHRVFGASIQRCS
jgi:hypothetical protein